ncbi:MAG TPA: C25 family cysteine peptidase, partial [bacterium]|nr:C25 family cysteine peptidase [bacterium]
MRYRSVPMIFCLFIFITSSLATAAGIIHDPLTWHATAAPQLAGDRVLMDAAPARLNAAGGPDLPMIVWTREYPRGTRVEGLEIRQLEETRIPLPAPLPVLPPKPTVNSTGVPGNKPGTVFNRLQGTDLYPNCRVELDVHAGLSPVSLQPVTFATVRLYPVRVDDTSMHSLTAFAADLVVDTRNADNPGASRGDAALLIIAPQEFLDVMGEYITHKTNAGIPVITRSLEDITATGTGRDVPEKIKMAIADICDTDPLGCVLLAGDADRIPVRYTFHAEYAGMSDWQNIPADLYYADLFDKNMEFCDWDANGNNIFGEFIDGNADGCDFAPDVLIGRIPASSVAELAGVLTKTMHYETTVTGSEPWQNRIVLAAADTFTAEEHGDITGVPEGEATKELIAGESLGGFDLVKLYETDRYERTAELTTQALHSAILDGAQY